MLVGFWRAVVSLLGGFPALRDAAGTKGERVGLIGVVVCTLASYGWSLPQLATDSLLYIALRTCIFSFLAALLFGDSSFAIPGSLRVRDRRVLE